MPKKDFREGWTVRGSGKLKWHFYLAGGSTSICGYVTRDGSGILATVTGVPTDGHCNRCLKIYEKKHPDKLITTETFTKKENAPAIIETPEDEIRHIEINILNEELKKVFMVRGTVSRRTAHKFMEYVGAAYVPQEPLRALRPPIPVRAIGKISCEHARDCTVYPDECSKCGNNEAKSYFKSKGG